MWAEITTAGCGSHVLDARRVRVTRASCEVASWAEWMNGGSIPQDLKTQERQVMGGGNDASKCGVKKAASQVNSCSPRPLISLLKLPVPQFLFVAPVACLLITSGQEVRVTIQGQG